MLDFYSVTAGTDWINNSNWLDTCSAEWFGVEVGNLKFDADTNFILNSGNVTTVALRTNNLDGNLPTTLGRLTMLQTLDLSSNLMEGTIPGFALIFLNHLQILDLGSNKLSGVIPVGLGNLSLSLKVLDLSMNELTGSIPFDLANMAEMEMLDLSDNDLTDLV